MRAALFALMLAGVAGLSGMVRAQTLDLPGEPERLVEVHEAQGAVSLPIGRFAAGAVPMRLAEGEITREVWRMSGDGLSSLSVTAALRVQLQAQGFAILLDCADEICGGFDFRRAIEVMPPPAMHVNLSDFRYLSAESSPRGGPVTRVGILVSTTGHEARLQIIRAGAPNVAAPVPTTGGAQAQSTAPPPAINARTFAEVLETEGHVALGDLSFETGSAELADQPFASLQWVADYLAAHPARRIALVGHTDSAGSLEVNVGLSKRRAASVVARLTRDYGVPREQIIAEGMGYLAPLAANLTAEGRYANRRVEAVLLSQE